mgnify:CR=1 FL=1
MNLQQTRKEEPEVNLTSLIDVVLLLLIFFMVSTSFVNEAEIQIRLPEASLEPAAGETQSLEIAVTAEGRYLVNQRPLVNARPETLRAALQKVAGDNGGQEITIRADAEASHQAVVTAMDIAGKLGFVNINIATVTPPDA